MYVIPTPSFSMPLFGSPARNFTLAERLKRLEMAATDPKLDEYRSVGTAEWLVSTMMDLDGAYEGVERASAEAYFKENMVPLAAALDPIMLCRATDRMRGSRMPPTWLILRLIRFLEKRGYFWDILTEVIYPGGDPRVQIQTEGVTWLPRPDQKFIRTFKKGDLVAVRLSESNHDSWKDGVETRVATFVLLTVAGEIQ